MPVSDENRQKWDRWLDRVSQIPDWSISLLEGSTYTPKQSAPKLRELVALLSGEPYSILREPYWNRGEWPEYLSTLNDRRKKAVELLREAERVKEVLGRFFPEEFDLNLIMVFLLSQNECHFEDFKNIGESLADTWDVSVELREPESGPTNLDARLLYEAELI